MGWLWVNGYVAERNPQAAMKKVKDRPCQRGTKAE